MKSLLRSSIVALIVFAGYARAGFNIVIFRWQLWPYTLPPGASSSLTCPLRA